MMIMRRCNVQTNEYDHQAIMHWIRLHAHIIKLHNNRVNKTQLSRNIYIYICIYMYIYVYINVYIYIYLFIKPTAHDGTATSGTKPRKNMTTMGKVDISDLMMMMIIKWVINKYSESRPHKLQRTSSTHTTPHLGKKIRKITKWINYILDILPTEYTQQSLTHASGIFHRMCSMQVRSSMHKAEKDLRPLCILPKQLRHTS